MEEIPPPGSMWVQEAEVWGLNTIDSKSKI